MNSFRTFSRNFPLALAALMAIACFVIALVSSEGMRFVAIGATGAIFANTTGAGGGVVFIPLFAQLGFGEAESLSTSFGIQCFGMTAGAITWCRYYRNNIRGAENNSWQSFTLITTAASLFSVAGIWTSYTADFAPISSLPTMFSVFSGVLGACILATIYLPNTDINRSNLAFFDGLVIILIAYLGGMITAWLSVAVGEMLAFYLIFRRYNVTMSIAAAVVVTAITVWSVAPIHLGVGSPVNWEILKFAGPGAIAGGIAARYLATYLPARKLKIFFAVWLLLISVTG